MKIMTSDKYGFPLEQLTEDVSDFGMPGVAEAKKHDYKGSLEKLLTTVEMHMAIMAGSAEEGAEDPLQATVDEIKAMMEPEEEGEMPEEMPEEPTEESISLKKKSKKLAEDFEDALDEKTASSTIKKYEALKSKKMWNKQEILGVAHQLNDLDRGGDMDEELKFILHELLAIFEEGKSVDISPEQSQQGIDWLKKNVINNKGELRDTGMVRDAGFNQESADVIKNFKKFELVGFHHDEQYHTYAPIYRTIAKDGSSFDYSVSGGFGGATIIIH